MNRRTGTPIFTSMTTSILSYFIRLTFFSAAAFFCAIALFKINPPAQLALIFSHKNQYGRVVERDAILRFTDNFSIDLVTLSPDHDRSVYEQQVLLPHLRAATSYDNPIDKIVAQITTALGYTSIIRDDFIPIRVTDYPTASLPIPIYFYSIYVSASLTLLSLLLLHFMTIRLAISAFQNARALYRVARQVLPVGLEMPFFRLLLSPHYNYKRENTERSKSTDQPPVPG